MHHPYTAEILSSCCLNVDPALLAPKVALLSEYGTLLSLTLPWSHKNFQEVFPVLQEFSFFTPAHWLWFLNRTLTDLCTYEGCHWLQWFLSGVRLMTMADYQVLVSRGAVTFSPDYCNIADATGVFLIYSIIEEEQNQSFVLLSAQHALCSLCSCAEFWLECRMIWFGTRQSLLWLSAACGAILTSQEDLSWQCCSCWGLPCVAKCP